ncbi:SDR family oxidoreductase [Acetobacter oeni]|uniref:Oxidoreductase n=1 Tax=Acetobacter oeni TaxID=304077 RepID=A0A511XNX9_9PROT|nr:SDR family oxidoreductase [Acetobacter oeni]MBB3884443.1 cyclic-di-GMP-binding biofilm dispersal mediator protein [Acetobacter oeni]NHO20387.1 SDR family oxidoreductase [Acetobacter oeni]GBR01701.1 oxidoreductase [Acetobacter oeni LMG 21952]GEN64672.1 oxidoreductase [Acetobacter oeni]
MSSFSGKSVLVLGGSRGIGAAIVRRFASDGAKVAFTYFSSPDDAQALATETGSEALRADSGDRDFLIALIDSLGPLDVLVVNSGILGAGDPLEIPPDDIDRLFRINIHAPYHSAVAAARHMPDGGRIVFIGSANADRMPMSGLAAYSASKSALKGMVKGLARDFGARGITVNVVQPGPTDTDMNPADGPLKDVMHSFMAIKRHTTSAEVAGLVAYLAGPEAGIITGAAYNIDGGFTA